MKKSLVLIVISLLAIGYVLAVGQSGSQPEITGNDNDMVTGQGADSNSSGSDVETQNKGENSEIKTQLQVNNSGKGDMVQAALQVKEQIKAGVQAQEGYKVYVNNNGEAIQIKSENGFGLKVGNVEASSMLQLRTEEAAEGDTVKATLSNGRNAEIKVMPSTASETAIQQLGLKVCTAEEGCTVELKEVGKGDETAPAYEVTAETEGKFLGLFKTRARVKTQVNAETGEILRVKKPFLTSVKTTEE